MDTLAFPSSIWLSALSAPEHPVALYSTQMRSTRTSCARQLQFPCREHRTLQVCRGLCRPLSTCRGWLSRAATASIYRSLQYRCDDIQHGETGSIHKYTCIYVFNWRISLHDNCASSLSSIDRERDNVTDLPSAATRGFWRQKRLPSWKMVLVWVRLCLPG